MSVKKRKLSSANTTGYTGVHKIGKRYKAQIQIDRKRISLGRYDTPKEAALAFDRAVIQHKFSSSRLNFPDGLSIDDEDYDELMNPKKKRKLHSRNTTGYNGVYKTVSKKFQARIKIDDKLKSLGTYDTPKEAALAFDRAVVQHKLAPSKLNYPDGLPIDDEDYEEFMNPNKKRKLASTNTSGYTGVYKTGEKFMAQIRIDGKNKYLGTYGTPKEAALAFDRAVIQHKLPSSKLNFPDGLPIDDEYYEEFMNPEKKRRLASRNTSGYTGVCKIGQRFKAAITIHRKRIYLGTHGTPKEAALAFDRAVIQHKLPPSKLNFPNDCTTTSEDDESSDEESDDSSSSSSSSSDSRHNSGNDDESDEEDAVEPPAPPQAAQPHFERDPMLDQLFAEEQNKKNKKQQEEQNKEEEEDSLCCLV